IERPTRVAEQSDRVQGKESQNEAEDEAQRREEAPTLMKPEAEGLGEPEVIAGQHAEQRAGYQHVVEMGDQELGVVDLVVDRGIGEDDAARTADDEEHREAQGVNERHGEADAPPEHGPYPVIDFYPRWDADEHRGNPENGVDIRALSHREEVVQPYGEREGRDR